MEFDKANWLSATAGRGLIDVDAGTLKLTDGLSVFTDTGYELHTPSADVYIRKNIFEGTERWSGTALSASSARTASISTGRTKW